MTAPTRVAAVPMVVEQTARGERGWDVFSRLLNDRVVFIGRELDDELANVVIAQLLFLDAEDADKDIMLYVHSPGGDVSAGLAIYDTVQFVHADVATYCVGQALSIASLLVAAGAPGKRYALPHARLGLHPPLAAFRGQATDIDIHAREILAARDTVAGLYARHTGQPVERILADSERDRFLPAADARAYGLIDGVLVPTRATGAAPAP